MGGGDEDVLQVRRDGHDLGVEPLRLQRIEQPGAESLAGGRRSFREHPQFVADLGDPEDAGQPVQQRLRAAWLAGAHAEGAPVQARGQRRGRAIGDQPGLSSRTLSEATFIEQTLVSKHLRKLVDAGLVQRELESTDARRVALHLTAQGKAIRETADSLGEEMERDFLSVLTPEELAQFNHCLAKLRRWGVS